MIALESSADIHKPEEEEASTMTEMDAHSPEEQLTDWLSKLFERLESWNSTCKSAQVETHPPVEEVVSSEVHTSSKGKYSIMAEMDAGLHDEELPDWISQMFEKLDMEINEDSICSMGKVTSAEICPLSEHGVSPEIHRSSKGEGSTSWIWI